MKTYDPKKGIIDIPDGKPILKMGKDSSITSTNPVETVDPADFVQDESKKKKGGKH